MKAFTTRKLMTGGLALSVMLGGGALYAFADNGGMAQPQQRTEQSQTQAQQTLPDKPSQQDFKHEHGKWMGKSEQAARPMKGVSDILGMKQEEIKAQLKSGKSLADIAQSKGISESDLIAKLSAQAAQKIDAAVKAGKLTQAKADELKANLNDKIKQAVERKGLPEWHKDKQRWMGGGLIERNADNIAGWFKMSKQELKAQLNAGKSLAEIAAEHGMSKDKLIAKLKDEMTPMLDKLVTHKHGQKPAKGE